jgi:cytochrome c oxidase assembly protein subunit 15
MYSENNNLNQQLKIWLFVLLSMIILIILIGGLTRLTDSGLSITTWELFVGFLPPLTNDKWKDYFDLYKTIPEYNEQNSSMFTRIFWLVHGIKRISK